MQWGTAAALLWLSAVNVAGVLLAASDKRRARRGLARTRERTFHVLALVGAWPALALAFAAFRHKTRKGRFLAKFAACAILDVVALAIVWSQGWLG